MDTVLQLIGFVGLAFFGVLIDRIWLHYRQGVSRTPVNAIPDELPQVDDGLRNMLECYLIEWEVVVNTQMRFNDLILRFRSIILTGFVTLIGALVAIQKIKPMGKTDFLLMVGIISILWVTACIVDFLYYNRMLLGAVRQATKFDSAPEFKKYGLFGLTNAINSHVQPPASQLLVLLYYTFPLGAVFALVCWKCL